LRYASLLAGILLVMLEEGERDSTTFVEKGLIATLLREIALT